MNTTSKLGMALKFPLQSDIFNSLLLLVIEVLGVPELTNATYSCMDLVIVRSESGIRMCVCASARSWGI